MSCPGSFLFGQRHSGGADASLNATADALPSICGLNGLLLPDARGSAPSLLCASCSRIPAALVSRDLLIAVDIGKLRVNVGDADDLLGRMESAEAAWADRLERRLALYSAKEGVLKKAAKESLDRIGRAKAALIAGLVTPEVFGHLARKLADEQDKEQDLWVICPGSKADLGPENAGKNVVILIFLNSIRLHNWRRSFKIWAGEKEAATALVSLPDEYLPLYPSPVDGISFTKGAVKQDKAIALSAAPSFDFDVLHDSATRLSLLLHGVLGIPPSQAVTGEILNLLLKWLTAWYSALVSTELVPMTKAGAVVQGGALVGNGHPEEEDEEADEFFPTPIENASEGIAVGTVLTATALVMKDILNSGSSSNSTRTVFSQCCGKPSVFDETPGQPSSHLTFTSFVSGSAVCVEHPHDHTSCSACKEASAKELPAFLAAKSGLVGKDRTGSFVVVGSEGSKVNLNPLSVLTFISMLPSKYFNVDMEPASDSTATQGFANLASLLARFPLASIPSTSATTSPLMDFVDPEASENIWTDPLSNLYGFSAALQASLGIETDANKDGGIGKLRDLLVVRGVEAISTNEIYGAEIATEAEGGEQVAGKEPIGAKVGTHM